MSPAQPYWSRQPDGRIVINDPHGLAMTHETVEIPGDAEQELGLAVPDAKPWLEQSDGYWAPRSFGSVETIDADLSGAARVLALEVGGVLAALLAWRWLARRRHHG